MGHRSRPTPPAGHRSRPTLPAQGHGGRSRRLFPEDRRESPPRLWEASPVYLYEECVGPVPATLFCSRDPTLAWGRSLWVPRTFVSCVPGGCLPSSVVLGEVVGSFGHRRRPRGDSVTRDLRSHRSGGVQGQDSILKEKFVRVH